MRYTCHRRRGISAGETVVITGKSKADRNMPRKVSGHGSNGCDDHKLMKPACPQDGDQMRTRNWAVEPIWD